MHIQFGNTSIITKRTTDAFDAAGKVIKTTYETLRVPGRSTTVYGPPPHWDLFAILEAFTAATTGVWASHSDQPPAWVACEEDPVIAAAFARHYDIPDHRPEDWEDAITGEPVADPALTVVRDFSTEVAP